MKYFNKIAIPISVLLNWLICWIAYIELLKLFGGSLGHQKYLFWPLEAPKIIIQNIPALFSSPWTYWTSNSGELFIALLVIISLIGGLPGGITLVIASWKNTSKRYLVFANLLLGYYFISSYFVLLVMGGE